MSLSNNTRFNLRNVYDTLPLTHVIQQTGRLFGFEMQHERIVLGAAAVEWVLEELLAGERRLGRYFLCGQKNKRISVSYAVFAMLFEAAIVNAYWFRKTKQLTLQKKMYEGKI